MTNLAQRQQCVKPSKTSARRLAAWQRRKEDAQGYRLVFVPFTQVLPQNRFGFDHQSV